MPDNTAIDLKEIEDLIYDGMYDHMSERGCSSVTAEAMSRIKALITSEKITLLERLRKQLSYGQNYERFGDIINAELKTLRGGK